MNRLRSFENSKILVSGGAGFIGSNFVRTHDGNKTFKKIYVLDSFSYAADIKRLTGLSSTVEIINASLSDTEKYISVLKDCNYVVNMAAESHVDRSITNGFPFIYSNIVGSFALFEACRHLQNISLIHVSTDEVYGSTNYGEFTELDSLSPTSIYSSSKAASDLLAMANFRTHQQKLVITRCTNNFGPYQNSEKFIPTVINNCILGKPIPIYGDGSNQREWIHVSDHNSALLAILNNFEPGNIYNIGSGVTISNLDLANQIIKLTGASENLIKFVEDRKGHDFRYALNSSKIRETLGWQSEHNFDVSLSQTVNWYQNWFNARGMVY
jgi:dTDP-glucose 4,6-dehydratase